MSIPAEKQRRDFQRFAWPVRIAPLAVAGTLAALWLSEAPDPAIGFSLSGPSVVAPGTQVALRAWHLTDHGVDAPPTVVELKDGSGALISTTTMTTSLAEGLEGEVSLPDDIEGTAFFVARTNIDESEVSLTYGVSVEPEDALRTYQPGRATSPFQVYELGPLRVVDAEGVRRPEVDDTAAYLLDLRGGLFGRPLCLDPGGYGRVAVGDADPGPPVAIGNVAQTFFGGRFP